MHTFDIPTRGYLPLISLFGVPILIHWTFFFAGAIWAWVFTDLAWSTTPWIILAFTLLVLIHELGHAAVPGLSGKRIHAIVITGSGGICINDLPDTIAGQFLYFSGGIIAQVILLLLTLAALLIGGEPDSVFGNSFVVVFTLVNGLTILVNLIPVGGSDGHQLCSLFREKWSAT